MLEVKELASVTCREVEKPGWLKRKLIWPLKSKLLRSLPFKVGTGTPLFGLPAHVQVLLVGLGVLDVEGGDTEHPKFLTKYGDPIPPTTRASRRTSSQTSGVSSSQKNSFSATFTPCGSSHPDPNERFEREVSMSRLIQIVAPR